MLLDLLQYSKPLWYWCFPYELCKEEFRASLFQIGQAKYNLASFVAVKVSYELSLISNHFSNLEFAFICRSLVKNMLMSYFNTPENKRAEVVRVVGALLGFTHEELDKVKLRGQR